MRAKVNKEVLGRIKEFFLRAREIKNENNARKYVAAARELAKRNNIRIPKELNRNFCHKCNSYFSSKNKITRIKNKVITIKCLNCNNYSRYKIK